MGSYTETVEKFRSFVAERNRRSTMVALIIDSPWIPGYLGVDTLEFYFDDETFLKAYRQAAEDLPGVVFIPGSWVEFGMAAEPSAWGVTVRWSRNQPPQIAHCRASLAELAAGPVPDPESDGLMPLVLRRYEKLSAPLQQLGMSARIAAARGPLTIASHVHGFTPLLLATQLDPKTCERFLDKVTDLCIAFLRAQLKRMADPFGILLLDDVVGMLSPEDFDRFAFPYLERIFNSFEGMIKIFHNDTPGPRVYPGIARLGIDVFNLSHKIPLKRARELLGPEIILMGNLPPLDLLARGTAEEVRRATEELLAQLSETGPVLVSPGGGVSPGTPLENLKAMVEVVRAFSG